MSGFNFGQTAKPVSTQSYLKAWSVYDNVEFDGISEPTTGKTSDGKDWKMWKFAFKCPDGIYEESVFEPNEDATKRNEYPGNDGKVTVYPSNIESFNCFIQHVVSVFMNDSNKAKFTKLAEEGKFNNIEFDKFIEVLKKLLANPKKPSKDYPIMIKLQGRTTTDGKVYARLPKARLGKDGNPWMERFIGPNLSLSDYEKKQAANTTASKPTNMEAVDKPTNDDLSNDDLDSLVDDLDNNL